MFVRKSLTGVLAASVAGAALALSTVPAHAAYVADADDTTSTPTTAAITGVGSDTSQHALKLIADAWNAQSPAPAVRLDSFAATSGGTLPLGGVDLTRPNGSGAGVTTLFNPSNSDVDFARSSDYPSDAAIAAGVKPIPFALDTVRVAVSNSTASYAPATLTPQQIVAIYKGDVTNWSTVGGADQPITVMIPQPSSGTAKFFQKQLDAINGGPVTLTNTVQTVQEHDPAPIRNNPNAIAPFSEGRAGLAGTALRLPTGFAADRALYNVVRGTDVETAPFQQIFGTAGFICSDETADLIEAAGFQQLARPADGGVCGTTAVGPTSNFTINEPVAPVATTTTVVGTSPAARALRVTARVAGSPTPTGTVKFTDARTSAVLGTASLIGGTATLNLANRAPGSYSIAAAYVPTADSAFVASTGTGSVKVKAASSIKESFPAAVAKKKKSVKGVVTVVFGATSTKPSGKITIKEGRKTVGTGTLRAGKVTITLTKAKLGKGRSTLKIVYGGDANGFGSQKTFTITFKK